MTGVQTCALPIFIEPHRMRVCNQQSENAAAARWMRHGCDHLGIHTEMQELLDIAFAVDNTEGAVFCVRQVCCGGDNAIER